VRGAGRRGGGGAVPLLDVDRLARRAR